MMGHMPRVVGVDIVEMALWAKVQFAYIFSDPQQLQDIFL